MRAKRTKSEVRGLAPGEICYDHALQIVGKRPILENVLLTEAKDHD